MSYVGSQNINVFPSTKRGQYQRDARLMTESSLVGLINELIDLKSFVITPIPSDTLQQSDPFEFNIAGYYFKIDRLDSIPDFNSLATGQSIVASIIFCKYFIVYTYLYNIKRKCTTPNCTIGVFIPTKLQRLLQY